jgi:diguanylate cyclase (GGDEF)-like protein/PAS domain S-box-containing protein
MNLFKTFVFCLLYLSIQFGNANYCFADNKEVRIGVLAFRPIEITKQQWQPTADYLNAILPKYHFTITALNYKDLDLAINRRQFEFVLTNPEHYITIHDDLGINAIATLMPSIGGHPFTTFGGVIFTRSDRADIKEINDIKGKVVASPTNQSLGGYSMQMWTLLKQGLQKNQIKQFRFTGMPHDHVVQEVIEGKADVGFVRTGLLEALARDGKIRLDQIKVLNRQSSEKFPLLLSTDLYPEWPLAAELDVPQSLIKLVAIALLNIQPTDRAAQIGQYYGFASTGDYSSVESLMKRISENPERAHEFELRDILRKYSIQLQVVSLIAILAILATAIHLYRVNKKVIRISNERERLTEKLEEVNSELEAVNQNLERTVDERTSQLRIMLNNEMVGIVTIKDHTVQWANLAFEKMLGYANGELNGKPTLQNFVSEEAYKCLGESAYPLLNAGKVYRTEIEHRKKNGDHIWVELCGSMMSAESGETLWTFVDITERKAAEDKIERLAFFDPLTHLPNRRLLLDRLQQALVSSLRSGEVGALLFIDLDNFKSLNDTLGHDVGDLLLQKVAERLTTCLREGDSVSRFGGDEFVVILEDLNVVEFEAAKQAELIAHKILATLNRSYQLNSHTYHNTPSIGATLFGSNKQGIEELLKQADIAMYQAKNAGRNTFRFFDNDMQKAINNRVEMESALRQAIDLKQFQLHYQIQVNDLRHPVGAEVLIRWKYPERGMVSPAQFIPLAEETGLILPIGQWVMETACKQLKAWRDYEHTRHLTLSVNVSAKQFNEKNFVTQVQTIVQRYAINPALLKLEPTESILLANIEETVRTMNALRAIGIQFALDDFGTGFSSLQYLKRLPLTQLKIDQSFVRDLVTDSNDLAIVRTIIAMAQSLGLEIIAEGVETEEQKQILQINGCNHFQGYLFGKPMSLEDFEASLRKS